MHNGALRELDRPIYFLVVRFFLLFILQMAEELRPLIFDGTFLPFESAPSISHCSCFAAEAAANFDAIFFFQCFPPLRPS